MLRKIEGIVVLLGGDSAKDKTGKPLHAWCRGCELVPVMSLDEILRG
jgi:hypothetical protein